MGEIQKEQMIKQERGITLIALIITIIVLLILAGVSIAMLTGENGILNRAESTEYAQAQAELTEEISLSINESVMECLATGEDKHNIAEVLKIAKNNRYINQDEHTIIVLGTNGIEEETETLIDNVSTSCTKAKVIHDQTGAFVIITMLENGSIVIGDEEQGTGNASDADSEVDTGTNQEEEEGLTIPEIAANGTILEQDTTFKDENGDEITIPGGFGVPEDSEADPLEDRDTVEEGFVIRDKNDNEFVWIPADENNIAYNNMVDSGSTGKYTSLNTSLPGIEPNSSNLDGDYDVTFEELENEYADMRQGIIDHKGFYISRYDMSQSDNTAESKRGVPLLTEAEHSGNMWYGLYEIAKTYTNGNVTSSMISNCEYDIMMTWMTINNETEPLNSSKNTTMISGESSGDVVSNVYDLTGGVSVFTTSTYSTQFRIVRGGNYVSNAYTASTTTISWPTGVSNNYVGTRFTLKW